MNDKLAVGDELTAIVDIADRRACARRKINQAGVMNLKIRLEQPHTGLEIFLARMKGEEVSPDLRHPRVEQRRIGFVTIGYAAIERRRAADERFRKTCLKFRIDFLRERIFNADIGEGPFLDSCGLSQHAYRHLTCPSKLLSRLSIDKYHSCVAPNRY